MSFQIKVRAADLRYGRILVRGETEGSLGVGELVRFSTGEVLTYLGMGHLQLRDGSSEWFATFRGGAAPELLRLAEGGGVTGEGVTPS